MTKKSTQAILGLCLFLLYSLSAEAQWDLGLQGGVSIPNLSASGSENNPLNTGYSSRLGPEFAIFGEYHVNSLVFPGAKNRIFCSGRKERWIAGHAYSYATCRIFRTAGNARTYIFICEFQ